MMLESWERYRALWNNKTTLEVAGNLGFRPHRKVANKYPKTTPGAGQK